MVRFTVGGGVTPAPLKVMIPLGSAPIGVPALAGGFGVELPPPPHDPITITEPSTSTANIVLQRRRRGPKLASKTPMHKRHVTARLPTTVGRPNAAGRLSDCGNVVEGAVVRKVTVAIAVVVVELRATEDTLKLHEVSDGSPEQRDDESGIVPLNAFIAVNVIVADPLAPGLLTTTVPGLFATVKVGAAVTTSAVLALEVA